MDSTRLPGQSSTAFLLARAQQGDRLATERLLERCRVRLRRWAHRRLPHSVRGVADTEDLVQDALHQVSTRLHEIDHRGAEGLHAYLRQTVLNRVRDHFRAVDRRPKHAPLCEELPDPAPSPLEQAIGQDVLARYESSLQALSPPERELIVGSLELGLDYGELAELSRRPSREAARKAVARAMVRLAAEMERRS